MSKPKMFAVLCALLMAAVLIFVVGSVMRTRREARMLIDELKDLSVSSRPNDTFDTFQWKYGRSKFKYSDPCVMHFCTYEVDISNNALAKLHFVQYTEMKAWFRVERGQLVSAIVEYRSAAARSYSPVVHVQQGICVHGCGVRFDLNPHGTSRQMWNGLVEFNPKATQSEREAALAFNLDCFYRIGGCKDITELLPTVWQRVGTDGVRSRFVGLSERLEDSHGVHSPDDL